MIHAAHVIQSGRSLFHQHSRPDHVQLSFLSIAFIHPPVAALRLGSPFLPPWNMRLADQPRPSMGSDMSSKEPLLPISEWDELDPSRDSSPQSKAQSTRKFNLAFLGLLIVGTTFVAATLIFLFANGRLVEVVEEKDAPSEIDIVEIDAPNNTLNVPPMPQYVIGPPTESFRGV